LNNQKKTAILFPFVGDSVGGSHWSIIELINEFKKSNLECYFAIHETGPLSNFFDAKSISYIILKKKTLAGERPTIFNFLLGFMHNFWQIRKIVKNYDIDIIHGNDLRINLTWSIASFFLKTKYIWHQRSLISNPGKWLFLKFLTNHIIAISDYVGRSIPKNVSPKNYSIINNPFSVKKIFDKRISKESICKNFNVSHNDFLVGYVGRLIEWKKVDELLLDFSNFYKNNPEENIRLLILGSGPEDYISKLHRTIKDNYLNDLVIFCGFSNEPSNFISGLDCLVAPSQSEPFGRTLIESMIQNTPVLAYAAAGHLEIVKDSVNGFLYSKSYENSFEETLKIIIRNPIKVNEVITKAHSFATKNYSEKKHFELLVKVYLKCLRN